MEFPKNITGNLFCGTGKAIIRTGKKYLRSNKSLADLMLLFVVECHLSA